MSQMNTMNRGCQTTGGRNYQNGAQLCQNTQPCQSIQPRQSMPSCPCRQHPNFEAMNQAQLLNYIDEVSFAAYDAVLFLDTHCSDCEALAYCREMISLREDAKAVYVRRFGPLTIDCTNDCESSRWEWIMQPWPWESMSKGGCR